MIKPQTPKGFRDFLPTAALAREKLVETARRVYRSYGFTPIDTPALELSEILLGKGGAESDKQLFRFTDQGGRDVAMRFDLTVPFARFAAQYANELGMPFKRYHLGTVWRGENTQRGRYREFMQCDFDTIGTDANSADIETLLVIHDLFVAIGFEGQFTIQVNNRKVLNGLLETLGLSGQTPERAERRSEPVVAVVLRSLDKLPKIGHDAVVAEMTEFAGATVEQATQVLAMTGLKGTADEILTQVEPKLAGSEQGAEGIGRLRELFAALRSAGIAEERVVLDLSIARGLDYYTGTIYETFLTADRKIGSVCSGGRYDNLAALFTNLKLPGVGASLGLDRLLAAMETFGMLEAASSPAQVFVVNFDQQHLGDYIAVCRRLRLAGLNVELFPEVKDLGKQLKFADKKGIPIALIAGETEFASKQWQIKDLPRRAQATVADADLEAHVLSLLGQPRP